VCARWVWVGFVLGSTEAFTGCVPDEAANVQPGVVLKLYRQLQAAGVSSVSVGHSGCFVDVHDRVLCVARDSVGRRLWLECGGRA
jgi:hypothetical protein